MQFDDKMDQVMKSSPKELVTHFSFRIFSMCALIMIFSLSVNYISLELPMVLAQEPNQTFVNENAAIEDNSNLTQSSTFSGNDKNNVTKNSNQRNKDGDNNSSRLITLVTEDVEIDIAPGERVKAWTFNGTVPWTNYKISRR